MQYGIDRDRSILDFYHQHNLDYNLGLNNFRQTDSDDSAKGDCPSVATRRDRRNGWNEFLIYLRQPLHPVPKRIHPHKIELNLPQLTFAQLKQKYSQFWGADNNYFIGGETQATATLNSFLSARFHGYHWKVSRP